MKNHLFEDQNKVLHLCERSERRTRIDPPVLVWTKCEIDVPANGSFESVEQATCPKCLHSSRKSGGEEK